MAIHIRERIVPRTRPASLVVKIDSLSFEGPVVYSRYALPPVSEHHGSLYLFASVAKSAVRHSLRRSALRRLNVAETTRRKRFFPLQPCDTCVRFSARPLSHQVTFWLVPSLLLFWYPAEEQSSKVPPDQLDSLVAPIALYPDSMLAQVLAASTYPLELIQLQQWLAKNSGLKDKVLADAVAKQPWDPSVQALAAMPDVVKRLADDIQWTTDLGNAFLAQQSDVMDAVQRMRKKAKDKGNLKSTEQQKVETKTVENKTVIVVEQSNPQVVYVPSYDPVVVYGPPVYPYPPVYYPPPGYYAAGMAISFGVGVAMGAFWSGGWGWNCGWGGNNNVYINNNNNFVCTNNSELAGLAAASA
jgi:hypothetical protein